LVWQYLIEILWRAAPRGWVNIMTTRPNGRRQRDQSIIHVFQRPRHSHNAFPPFTLDPVRSQLSDETG
jgi:hypothetical protein